MMIMNEWEIEEAYSRHYNDPVLRKATYFLVKFKDEVNAHSDGWCYWRQPVNAARKLMDLICVYKRHWVYPEPPPATEAQLNAAIKPIRAFYTRKGLAAGMRWPEDVL